MTRLRVNYHDSTGRGFYYYFFEKFITNLEIKTGEDVWTAVCRSLTTEYHASNVTLEAGCMDIDFVKDEDLTYFLLRWA